MKSYFIVILIVGLFACANDPKPFSPPLAPVATNATNIVHDGFSANWQSSLGATGYDLYVAADFSFTDTVFLRINVLKGTFFVDSLSGNTEYFYNVRATINNDHASENSNIIDVITLPDAPVAIAANSANPSGFTTYWHSVTDVTNYLFYLSEEDFPADPPNNLANYNGIEVTDTTLVVTGLNSGTTYYYVVKSKVDVRISEESNSILAKTKL